MITNLRYDKFNNVMIIKEYGKKVLSYKPFIRTFYAKSGQFESNRYFTVETSNKRHFFTKELVDKIVIHDTNKTDLFDKLLTTRSDLLYLYDLAPEYQYLNYNDNIKLSSDYNVCYLDIENDDDLNVEEAKSPIFLITLLYKDVLEWKMATFNFNNYSSERIMLREFFKFLLDVVFPDVVLGWNVIGFDLTYIMNRAKVLGVSYDKNKLRLIEFVNGSDIIIKKEGYGVLKDTGGMSLQAMSTFFLKRGKLDLDGMKAGELFRKDPIRAIKYNRNDVQLVKDLDDRLNMIQFLIKIQEVSNVLIRDTFFNSIVIDNMLIRRYPDYVFPSKEFGFNETEKFEGGYVFPSAKGVFEDVILMDYASMYPSIILTFNISPDTKTSVGYDYHIDGVGFKAEPYGIFKETIKFLYDKRLFLKGELKKFKDSDSMEYRNTDTLQSAYKTILNSVYGVMGYPKFRLYDVDIAKSITSMGRKMIKMIRSECEDNGLGVLIAGDTDSCFLQVKIDPQVIIDKVNNEFIPKYLSVYKLKENYLKMELKDRYEKMALFGKKKVYIAKIKDSNKFLIKGFSTEKYDTPKKIRVLYKEIIETLFNGGTIDVLKYREIVNSMSLEELSMIKKFNKPKDQYKVMPQHLKALKFSEKYLPIAEDTKTSNLIHMVFCKIDEAKYPMEKKQDVIIIDDNIKTLPEGIEINYEKYFQFFFIQKLEDLYEVFNVKYEELDEKAEDNIEE